ncbi:MAG: hypothetical protein GXO26_04275 [Crenarchaeota archaeon]|nr:hypothetical protein [Thermoproteota archaeon]
MMINISLIEYEIEYLLEKYVKMLRRFTDSFSINDVIDIILSAYGYKAPRSYFIDIVKILEDIIKIVSNIDNIQESYRDHVVSKLAEIIDRYPVDKVVLVDNLGILGLSLLPLYESIEIVRIHVLLNVQGSTKMFKQYFNINYLRELSLELSAEFTNEPDIIIHERLEKVLSYDELILELRNYFDSILRVLKSVGTGTILLVSDHGHDIVKVGDNAYVVSHKVQKLGRFAAFSKISPIMIVKVRDSV